MSERRSTPADPPRVALFLAGRDPEHPTAGGGDAQAWVWARWCHEHGYRVVYLCQSHPELADTTELDGIEVHRIGSLVTLPIRAAAWYRRNRDHIDLVYDDPIGAGRVPFLSPLFARTARIAVWHQVTAPLFRELYPRPVAAVLAVVERLVARLYRTTHMWVPSEERRDELADALGFHLDRLHVISPTIPDARLDRGVDVGGRDPVVTFLGVLRPYKGIEDLVLAMEAATRACPEARLVIAGRSPDDTYLASLQRLVESHPGANAEIRVGLSDDEKWALLRSSRLLALPSSLEGFGIVTLEANAVGVPVVASSGVPMAAVEDGVNGYRFPYGDRVALADRIVSILQSDDYPAMCAASLAHVDDFTESRGAERMRALVARVRDDATVDA
ncbi:MAG: glycosyltransferase family 4 protein [Actinomycetota bacterium]